MELTWSTDRRKFLQVGGALLAVAVLFLASRYPSQEEFVEFEKGR